LNHPHRAFRLTYRIRYASHIVRVASLPQTLDNRESNYTALLLRLIRTSIETIASYLCQRHLRAIPYRRFERARCQTPYRSTSDVTERTTTEIPRAVIHTCNQLTGTGPLIPLICSQSWQRMLYLDIIIPSTNRPLRLINRPHCAD
jgi:hypothetical protein